MGEIRKDNLHESLIQELNDLGNIDLSGKQDKNDNGLNTDSKVIVGAINELKNKFDALYIQYEEVKNQVNESLKVIECVTISLNNTNLILNSGTLSQELTATVLPSDCTEKVVWFSSDENVATVTNGVVVAVNNGNCVINAVCGAKIASCNVKVSLDCVLVEDGAFIDTTTFGDIKLGSVKVDSTNQRLEFGAMMYGRYNTMVFQKLIPVGGFTSTAKIKIQLATTDGYINTPVMHVLIVDNNSTTMYDSGFNGTKHVYASLANGHADYKDYTINLTGFSTCSGYLAIAFSCNDDSLNAKCYVKRIEFIE